VATEHLIPCASQGPWRYHLRRTVLGGEGTGPSRVARLLYLVREVEHLAAKEMN
jgi:hypothetical protein